MFVYQAIWCTGFKKMSALWALKKTKQNKNMLLSKGYKPLEELEVDIKIAEWIIKWYNTFSPKINDIQWHDVILSLNGVFVLYD